MPTDEVMEKASAIKASSKEDEEEISERMSAFLMHSRLLKLLEPLCGEKILEWKGHFKNGDFFYNGGYWGDPGGRVRSCLQASWLLDVSEEDFEKLKNAVEGGTQLSEPITIKTPLREFHCPFCDERLLIACDGKRLSVASEPCARPKGLITEWELNVPSGKLAIANDLREWFPTDGGGDLNTTFGVHLTILAYAEVGMAHGFVGNTCPGVYRNGEDKFAIGTYQEDVWNDETEEDEPNPEPCPWGERVAGICTDLWWYSIVDYDELRRRIPHFTPGKTLKKVLKEESVKTLSVRPGVYRFRQDHGLNRSSPTVEYATFEWARDPDPLVDYVGREKTKWTTALEYLIEQCLSWPTLFMGLSCFDKREKDRTAMVLHWMELPEDQKNHALARAASHAMVTIGNGVDWHEKGFPRETISEEAMTLARLISKNGLVPALHGRNHWYPISRGYSILCQAAGVRNEYHPSKPIMGLAPTFVLLGLNICQNAIQHGEDPQVCHEVWPKAYDIPSCREHMKTFGECYRELRKLYPDLVFDTTFDQWMQTVDFDKYVEDFDFGPKHPPEDTWGPFPKTVKLGDYFELDANKLKDGSHFCWHPKYMTGWAKKKDAQRYCLHILSEETSPLGFPYTKESGCGANKHDATVPLKVLGRVIQGTSDTMRGKLLEVAFDYGTRDMQSERWSLQEEEMPAVRQFSDPGEYASLLTQYKEDFLKEEAVMDEKVAQRERQRNAPAVSKKTKSKRKAGKKTAKKTKKP